METSCRKKYKPSPKKWILASKRTGFRRNSALVPANAGLFHYAGNNPVRYIDPDGRDVAVAVDILKNSDTLSWKTKIVMNKDRVNNLYKAEDKRLSFLEKYIADGDTIGRGQVSKKAYNDVMENFGTEIKEYEKEMGIKFSGDYKKDMRNDDAEDFIVSAYLSLCIEKRQKEGRSSQDAAKFGIGYYHGASPMIKKAQSTNPNILSFDGTENSLVNGSKKERDLLNYINEVLYGE